MSVIWWLNTAILIFLVAFWTFVAFVKIREKNRIRAGYYTFDELSEKLDLLSKTGKGGDVLVARGRWTRKFLQFVKGDGETVIFDVPLINARKADEVSFLEICARCECDFELINDERGRALQISVKGDYREFLLPFTDYLGFKPDEVLHIEYLRSMAM